MMTPRHAILSVTLLSLFSSGCFSGIYQLGASTSGDGTVAGKVFAATLDVATAPIQAPFWIANEIDQVQLNRKMELEKKIQFDPEFRRELVYSYSPKQEYDWSLASNEVFHALEADEVRFLWNKLKDQPKTFQWRLISSNNTPPDVLREYYTREKAWAKRAYGSNYSDGFVGKSELLEHPNLPPDILSELKSYNNPRVNQILKSRKMRRSHR